MFRPPPSSTLFPYTTLFRSLVREARRAEHPAEAEAGRLGFRRVFGDRKSTRLNSSHTVISYAVFCLKKKKIPAPPGTPRRHLYAAPADRGRPGRLPTRPGDR